MKERTNDEVRLVAAALVYGTFGKGRGLERALAIARGGTLGETELLDALSFLKALDEAVAVEERKRVTDLRVVTPTA